MQATSICVNVVTVGCGERLAANKKKTGSVPAGSMDKKCKRMQKSLDNRAKILKLMV